MGHRDHKYRWLIWAGAAFVAGGFVLGAAVPVGQYCSGAFTTQYAAIRMDDDQYNDHGTVGHHADACNAAAGQYSVLWWALIAVGAVLFVAGLIQWYLTRRPAPPQRTGFAPDNHRVIDVPTGIEESIARLKEPLRAGRRPGSTARVTRHGSADRRGPVWPFVVGAVVIFTGIALGYWIPVGPYCDGAFDTNQMTAAGADIANAGRTDYSSLCHAMAGQQAGIYWGIIGFGAALVVLGLVLGYVSHRPAVLAQPPAPASAAAELAHLAQLRDQGVLTQDEFEQQKAKLLSA